MAGRLLVIGALAAALAATTGGCTSTGESAPAASSHPGSGPPSPGTSRAYTVTYHPGDFSPNVDNPWFPLKPGTTLVYRGTKDNQKALDEVAVSPHTSKLGGVPCRVVFDRLYLDGKLAETTRDYYTQDTKGNVWYFGEDTAELDPDGNMVNTEGTWHTGENGALPGIFMPASPRAGESHRQEFYPGHAEDFFQVLARSAAVSVPYRSFPRALLTKEWTPLEPGVLDHKYYVQGIGTVKETTVKGPPEHMVLVAVKTG